MLKDKDVLCKVQSVLALENCGPGNIREAAAD